MLRAVVPVLTVLALLAPPSGAAGVDAFGVPVDLPADARGLRDGLLDVGNGTWDAWPAAAEAHRALAGAFADLAERPAARLAGFVDLLGPEVAAQNETNARSLASAAARVLDADLLPAAEAWQRHRTAVVLGTPVTESEDRVAVPLVLVNAPPGGFAAFEVTLHYDAAQLVPRDARVTAGQGDAAVDAENATVRFASFDARGLAGLGGGTAPVELGQAVFDAPPEAGAPLRVEVVDLVDRAGEPIPAVGGRGELDPSAAVQGGAAGSAPRIAAVAAVLVLGAGAIVVARKYLKV